jgi:protein TonB
VGLSGRGLIITLLVSLGLHAAAVTAVLLLLRGGVPVVDTPDKPTEVELVMEEHKGDLVPTSSPAPSPPAPPATSAATPARDAAKPTEAKAASTSAETPARDAAKPTEAKAASPPAEAPVEAQPDAPEQTAVPARASDPAPAAAATPAQEATRAPEPAPPAAPPTPTITLSGTDSPSDARAFGDRILPAAPDAVFHNRPPEYPEEAALNGEHGTVVVVVHVSPAGRAAGVDLVRSSGYVLLDRAASEAVLRWRFLPAVKDGHPVASDMTMGFVFDNQ